MKVDEASLSTDLQGSITKPAEPTGWGVVVLAGSSGRVDVARAKLLALWPSDMFAKPIAERLASAGKNATLVHHPNAGHRLLFPSETTLRSIHHAHGGSDEADAELGRSAWDAISALLRQ